MAYTQKLPSTVKWFLLLNITQRKEDFPTSITYICLFVCIRIITSTDLLHSIVSTNSNNVLLICQNITIGFVCRYSFFFFEVLGFELRACTLSPFSSPF
jgi:hypothetical protein